MGHWLFWMVACLATLSLFLVVVVQLVASVAISRAARRELSFRGEVTPVTILKPIKGVDVSLEENLEAFARQDYPSFELILGIEDRADPAIQVVRRFQRNHPECAIQVVIGAPIIGLNPKVNNLTHMSRFARHDLWLISDADVFPAADYLSRLVEEWQSEGVGLVHSRLVGCGEDSFGASLESIHLNTLVASSIWGASFVGHGCVIGKSMLFHRDLLADLGGWRTVENVLAEDYVLGRLVQQRGLGVRLSTQALAVRNIERTFSSFINRHLRWAQMRRRVHLSAYFSEALSNPIGWLMCLLALALAGVGEAVTPLGFSLGAVGFIVVKCCSDALMARSVRPGGLRLSQVLLIPVKDLIIFAVWFVGFFKRTVDWRGNVMLIGPGSQLSPSAKHGLAADQA